MGKHIMDREKYSEKGKDVEPKGKVDGRNHGKLKSHRNDASKCIVSKGSRSFADVIGDTSPSEDIQRQHRRYHNHQHSQRTSSRHPHHRHRQRHEHSRHQSSAMQIETKTVADVDTMIDWDEEQLKPAPRDTSGRLESPAMLSVSSSHSSLSTTHYSHSPAVVVDSESSHSHNNEQSSPAKNKNSSSKPNHNITPPVAAKRSRTHNNDLNEDSEADSDSNSDSTTGSSTHSSKKKKRSNSSNSESSSGSEENSNTDSSIDSTDSEKSLHSNAEAEAATAKDTNQTEVIDQVKITDRTNDNLVNVEKTPEVTNGQLVLENRLLDYYPGVQGCRSVEEFQRLNRIEEGTYGVVYRAKDKKTGELVALKRLKMEKETEGFPITSLREINTLLKGQHPNIVTVREIVVGSDMDQIFIVMDYVEHDMKSLMQTMKQRKQSFLPSEIKCLTQQLLSAVAHLHDNWILHRDLKTSNLLLSHKGILKVADFGMAREYGSPLKRYTPVVVTLWYRAPELLLGCPEYSTPVDMWSVGCIFAEWLLMNPLFQGEKEIDQLHRIFKMLGTPNEKIWPGYSELPGVKNILSQNSQFADYPISHLRKRFGNVTTQLGIDLLQKLLTYNPEKRLTADMALNHEYFTELPLPVDPSMFPTWPAKSEFGQLKKVATTSGKAAASGVDTKKPASLDDLLQNNKGGGFQLKF